MSDVKFTVQETNSYEVDLEGLQAFFPDEWQEFVDAAKEDDLDEPDEGDVRDFITESFLSLRFCAEFHDYFSAGLYEGDISVEKW